MSYSGSFQPQAPVADDAGDAGYAAHAVRRLRAGDAGDAGDGEDAVPGWLRHFVFATHNACSLFLQGVFVLYEFACVLRDRCI